MRTIKPVKKNDSKGRISTFNDKQIKYTIDVFR